MVPIAQVVATRCPGSCYPFVPYL